MTASPIHGPEILRIPGEDRMVKTREDYVVWQHRMLAELAPHATIHTVADVLQAYVNDGRWVVDCRCGSGCLTRPGWEARCGECGAVYDQVTFPKE